MTEQEKELAEFIFNSSGISLSISIPDLENLAKDIIQRYPQIIKKPLKQIWSGDIRDLHLTKIVDLLKFISDQKTKIKVYMEVVEWE